MGKNEYYMKIGHTLSQGSKQNLPGYALAGQIYELTSQMVV